MVQIGYSLSSEEHHPVDMIRNARRAEEVGFQFALISDHYHPWTNRQGQSAFVWNVIGAIAQVTSTLRLGTGVTCPTIRIHPAIIAQAAATSAAMMPGRFFLGVGSGENLNEHILGDDWPEAEVRLEMLREAVDIIHTLWQGGMQSYHGTYYEVENARIYTLPDEPPPIAVAAAGKRSARLAGEIGDSLISTVPNQNIVSTFDQAGGNGRSKYLQMRACWAKDDQTAIRTLHEVWPIDGFKGPVLQELPLPSHFEQVATLVREEDVAHGAYGPNVDRYLERIQAGIDAGFDHIYLHQVGPDQEGFFAFAEREILPKFQ